MLKYKIYRGQTPQNLKLKYFSQLSAKRSKPLENVTFKFKINFKLGIQDKIVVK